MKTENKNPQCPECDSFNTDPFVEEMYNDGSDYPNTSNKLVKINMATCLDCGEGFNYKPEQMSIQEAMLILKSHNEWRRSNDNDDMQMQDPKKLGIAIDFVLHELDRALTFIDNLNKLNFTDNEINE